MHTKIYCKTKIEYTMKTRFKTLVIAIISIPSALMAQKLPFGAAPFSPAFKEKLKDFSLISQTVAPGPQSLFGQHLPSIVAQESKKFFTDRSQIEPAYYYTMPVVNPGATSKIPVAEPDPNSLYTYAMPVKRFRIAEK